MACFWCFSDDFKVLGFQKRESSYGAKSRKSGHRLVKAV